MTQDTAIRLQRDHNPLTYRDPLKGVEVACLSNDGGTEQTARRVTPDPIQAMYRAGSLTLDQTLAAHEIRRIYIAIVSGLMARSQIGWRTGRAAGDMVEWIACAYTSRYKPWAEALGKMVEHGDRDRGPLAIAIAVAVEGRSIKNEVAPLLGLRKETVAARLRLALDEYLALCPSGWASDSASRLEREEGAQ